MQVFLLIYTLAMIASSIFTLGLVPRALREVGHERQRLREKAPEASFERMLEAGYRLNTLLLLAELLYYFLLLRFAGDNAFVLYGAFTLGLIHIAYLVTGRWERRRLAQGKTRTRGVRLLIWLTTVLTFVELVFLVFAGYFMLFSFS